MKSFISSIILVSVCQLVGCKKPPQRVSPNANTRVTVEAGPTIQDSDLLIEPTAPNGESPAPVQNEWVYNSVAQENKAHYSLADHIKTNAQVSSLHKYASDSGLGFGEKSKLRVETSLTSDLMADTTAKDTGVIANFKVDFYAFNHKFSDGLLVDYYAFAHPEDPSRLETHMRFVGYDKVVTNGHIDEHFMRQLSVLTIPIVPAPPAQVLVNFKVGGTLGLRSELGVQRDQQFNLLFQPEVELFLTVSGGVRLVALVDAKAEGQIKLLAMKPSLSANLGLNVGNFTYANLTEDNGGINAIDGKIDLVVDLGYKGLFPFGVDRILFEKAVTALGYGNIAKGKEWRWNVFDPEPVLSNSLPIYEKPIVFLHKAPTSEIDCQAMASSFHSFVEAHMNDLKVFADKKQDVASRISQQGHGLLQKSVNAVLDSCGTKSLNQVFTADNIMSRI